MFKYLYDLFMSFVAFLMGLCGANKIEPESEVKEIFNFEGCKTISSMRSDIGDTWFVMMDSEEDAKDTLLDLKLKKRMFRGQPVKGRLKSETVVRSFYPVQAAPAMPPVGIYPGIFPHR